MSSPPSSNIGKSRLTSALCWYWLPVVLTIGLGATFILEFVWLSLHSIPINIDETFRLQQALYVASGEIPNRTFASVLVHPGLWLFFRPVATFVSPEWLPLAGRLWGIALLPFYLGPAVWLLTLFKRSYSYLAALFMFLFLGACPHLLFKIIEFRPDGAASALILAGVIIFFRYATTAGKLAGLALIGAGISFRFDMALVLPPLMLAILFEKRSLLKRVRLGIVSIIEILATIILITFILFRGQTFTVLSEIMLFRISFAGKGFAGISNLKLDHFVMLIVILFGVLGLIYQLRPEQSRENQGIAITLFGSTILFLTANLVFRVLFLQNLWRSIYFLLPFAGLFAAKLTFHLFERFRETGWKRWLTALTVALAFVWITIPVAGQRKAMDQRITPKEKYSQTNALEGAYPKLMDGKFPISYLVHLSPIEMSRFLGWLKNRLGEDFTFYANDFQSSIGNQLPPKVVGNFDIMIRSKKRLYDNEDSIETAEVFYTRFPQAAFIKDGKQYSPAKYLCQWQPDALLADHMLYVLTYFEPCLSLMLEEHYNYQFAFGQVPVYIRKSK